MIHPSFINEVPRIRLYDPLSEFLGALDGGVVEYGYLDAVKLAGHSCPTVASAYWITCKALRALYPEEMPERGNIRVAFRRQDSDGVCGVIASITTLLTGAGGHAAFKGIGGRFDRRHKLLFGADVPVEMRFTRLDKLQSVDAAVDLRAVPAAPRMAELLPLCLAGRASEQERMEFRSLWQGRVRAVLLEHAEDARVYSVSEVRQAG